MSEAPGVPPPDPAPDLPHVQPSARPPLRPLLQPGYQPLRRLPQGRAVAPDARTATATWRMVLGPLLVVLGIIVGPAFLYIVLREGLGSLGRSEYDWSYQSNLAEEYRFFRSAGEGTQDLPFFLGYFAPWTSAALFLSAAAVIVGLLMMRQRFSMQRLLASALLAGFFGAIPHLLAPNLTGRSRCEVRVDRELGAEQVNRIRSELAPAAALKTLPQGALPYAASQAERITAEVKTLNGGRTCILELSFSPEIQLEARQRSELTSFFFCYFELLAGYEANTANTGAGSYTGTFQFPAIFNFSAHQANWESGLKTQVRRPVVSPPSVDPDVELENKVED